MLLRIIKELGLIEGVKPTRRRDFGPLREAMARVDAIEDTPVIVAHSSQQHEILSVLNPNTVVKRIS